MKNKNLKLAILALLSMPLLCSCDFVRTNPEDFKNCVIIEQHCGFDNLDAGYYHVKDLTTGKVYRIDVDIRDCDVYKVGDTIR